MSDRKYNILFVCDFPFAGAGGVGRVTETLAAEFLRRGHAVTYLSFCVGESCETEGIHQIFPPEGQVIASQANTVYLQGLLTDLQIDIIINQGGVKPGLIELFKQVDRGEAKLLSVHHNSVAALQENYPQIIAESYRGSPIAQVLRQPFLAGILKAYNRRKLGKLFRDALSVSDRLVLLSERFIPELEIFLGKNASFEKVVGIVNPAPFDVVSDVESKKENRLLYVGRIEFQQKRCDLLIDLWKRLFERHPDWSLDVVGDGSARRDLEERVRQERLPRIVFHGYQDPRPYLQMAKVFCMTSAYEGYGMVLVEAQAYGVVPLAFDCFSALADIISDGEDGYILPKFDVEGYVGRLDSLMRDDLSRIKMAEAGQKAVQKFMPSAVGDQWEMLFSNLRADRGVL